MRRAGVDADGFNVYKPRHGTLAEYGAGCRCKLCVKASRNYQRGYRREVRAQQTRK